MHGQRRPAAHAPIAQQRKPPHSPPCGPPPRLALKTWILTPSQNHLSRFLSVPRSQSYTRSYISRAPLHHLCVRTSLCACGAAAAIRITTLRHRLPPMHMHAPPGPSPRRLSLISKLILTYVISAAAMRQSALHSKPLLGQRAHRAGAGNPHTQKAGADPTSARSSACGTRCSLPFGTSYECRFTTLIDPSLRRGSRRGNRLHHCGCCSCEVTASPSRYHVQPLRLIVHMLPGSVAHHDDAFSTASRHHVRCFRSLRCLTNHASQASVLWCIRC